MKGFDKLASKWNIIRRKKEQRSKTHLEQEHRHRYIATNTFLKVRLHTYIQADIIFTHTYTQAHAHTHTHKHEQTKRIAHTWNRRYFQFDTAGGIEEGGRARHVRTQGTMQFLTAYRERRKQSWR